MLISTLPTASSWFKKKSFLIEPHFLSYKFIFVSATGPLIQSNCIHTVCLDVWIKWHLKHNLNWIRTGVWFTFKKIIDWIPITSYWKFVSAMHCDRYGMPLTITFQLTHVKILSMEVTVSLIISCKRRIRQILNAILKERCVFLN